MNRIPRSLAALPRSSREPVASPQNHWASLEPRSVRTKCQMLPSDLRPRAVGDPSAGVTTRSKGASSSRRWQYECGDRAWRFFVSDGLRASQRLYFRNAINGPDWRPQQGKEPRDRCLHGNCRRQHGRLRLLPVATGRRSLRHPGDRRLGPHGSRRNLPRAHLCQARKTAAGNRRALCLYPHRLWRFPGISDCLGLLDLDLGITAGHCGGLCRRHHRHVSRPAQPDHGDGADAGGASGLWCSSICAASRRPASLPN